MAVPSPAGDVQAKYIDTHKKVRSVPSLVNPVNQLKHAQAMLFDKTQSRSQRLQSFWSAPRMPVPLDKGTKAFGTRLTQAPLALAKGSTQMNCR